MDDSRNFEMRRMQPDRRPISRSVADLKEQASITNQNLKHIHDTQTVHCQVCWMELSECPGHPRDDLRTHGSFYVRLLKERTLMREAVAAGDLELAETLELLECVFERYHGGASRPENTIEHHFKQVQDDYKRTIPFWFPTYGETPSWSHTRVESEVPYTVQGSTEGAGREWTGDIDWSDDRYTEEFKRQLARQAVLKMEQTGQYAGSNWQEGPLTDPELVAANERLNGMAGPAQVPFEDTAIGRYLSDEGIKHDEGKDRWDLLPPSIQKVVEVYTIGARKYDDDNWAKGMGYRRIFGAMMRHAWKWFWGESYDQQDGQHHLASVVWACLTLMHYEDEGVGTDDRAFKPMDRPVPPSQALGADGFEDRTPVEPTAVKSECTWQDAGEYEDTFDCPVHGWH